MNLLVIQIIIALIAVLASAAAVRRFLRSELRFAATAGWLALWAAIVVAVLAPRTTEFLARLLGVGRGVDVVLYLSVVFLFYLQFRTLLRIEKIDRALTEAVRASALKEFFKEEEKKE